MKFYRYCPHLSVVSNYKHITIVSAFSIEPKLNFSQNSKQILVFDKPVMSENPNNIKFRLREYSFHGNQPKELEKKY